jgi:benzoyl-CoA 2,3-dioxygenase component B
MCAGRRDCLVRAHNRRTGEFAAIHAGTDGRVMPREAWEAGKESVVPSVDDNLFIASLMRPERGRGAFASWIAPPRHGIDNREADFEYVKIP